MTQYVCLSQFLYTYKNLSWTYKSARFGPDCVAADIWRWAPPCIVCKKYGYGAAPFAATARQPRRLGPSPLALSAASAPYGCASFIKDIGLASCTARPARGASSILRTAPACSRPRCLQWRTSFGSCSSAAISWRPSPPPGRPLGTPCGDIRLQGGDIQLQGECLLGNVNSRPLLDKVRDELVGLIAAAPAVAYAEGASFLGAMRARAHACFEPRAHLSCYNCCCEAPKSCYKLGKSRYNLSKYGISRCYVLSHLHLRVSDLQSL